MTNHVAGAFLWCRHCGQPHPVGLPICPATKQRLSTRVHKAPKVPITTGSSPSIEIDPVAVKGLVENRYRIKKLLGEGASSRVYVAHDTALDKPVAIKILRPSANKERAFLRFEQEARVMLAISHPNVCRVIGFGRLSDSRPYLVMEFMEGKTLLSYLRKKRPLSERLAMEIVQQLLTGLSATHALGIVHRDVKPSNVFLAKQPGRGIGQVKLLDFGLAKAPAERAIIVTRPGHAFGTPGYAAPEVLSGGAASYRCDIWSTGVILFELLAGVRPFRDPTAELSAFAIACGPARQMRDYRTDVSHRIVALINEALAKNPDQRIPTADEFLRRLMDIADDIGSPSSNHDTQTMTIPTFESDVTLPILDRSPLPSVAAESADSKSPKSTGSNHRWIRR